MPVREKKRARRLVTLVTGSPWLMIALGLHVIVGAWISVLYLHQERAVALDAGTAIAVGARRADPEPPPPEEPPIDRHKIPEERAQGELVPVDEETFVPVDEIAEDPELLYEEPGDPTGTDDGGDYGGGTSISVGPGAGWRGSGTSAFPKRGGPGGRGGPKRGPGVHGVPVDTERAVYEGLCWLVRHQDEDGAWRAAGYASHCRGATCLPEGAETPSYYDEGLTGLALLAFLGQGLSTESKIDIRDRALGRRHVAGDVVKRGVRWLIERQKTDGSFSATRTFLYNEAIAALALCEAHALALPRNRTLAQAAQRAVDFLVAAQKVDGEGRPWGWRYGSRADLDRGLELGEIDPATHAAEVRDADLSVTCWAVMALKSAALTGLDVPPEALAGALAFAENTAGRDGLAGYQAASQAGDVLRGAGDHFEYHVGTMSALSMLVRTFVRHDLADPFLEPAARRLAADLPRVSEDGLSVDYYYWYHATLALNQFDGPDSPRRGAGAYWKPWNAALVEALLELQDASRERDVCTRGGWLTEDRWAGHGGHALYSSALNVLTLEVYYRYENAFGAVPIQETGAPSASPK